MKRYPQSFLQLVTYGYVLVVIPFLLASAYIFVTLKTLDERYHVTIQEYSATSLLAAEIAEDLAQLERTLRGQGNLDDAAALDEYARDRSEWLGNVEALSRLPAIPQRLSSELQDLLRLERQAYERMPAGRASADLRSAIEESGARLPKILAGVNAMLDEKQAQFKVYVDRVKLQLFLAMGSAILIALCCIWLSRRVLSRLIGRFEAAVLRLGKGDLCQAIALDGPRDLRWLGRWLEWLRRRLLSLEQGRTQVLRHISHELKTPLAALREGSNLLAEEVPGPLTVEQKRIVDILQGNSRRLQDLIEGLLRLQQAGYAAERIGLESLRFDRLVEQVVGTYRLIAAERQIEFQVDLAEIEIMAGREGLLTIVDNLLSNAVKFSPDGGRVAIVLRREGNHACLDVSDEGPGISEHDRAQIFEPFYRSPAARSVAGVGLGLAIAREFVLAHRGRLLLVDAPQGGAHFRVVMPLEMPAARVQ